jgi:hypothetical protein
MSEAQMLCRLLEHAETREQSYERKIAMLERRLNPLTQNDDSPTKVSMTTFPIPMRADSHEKIASSPSFAHVCWWTPSRWCSIRVFVRKHTHRQTQTHTRARTHTTTLYRRRTPRGVGMQLSLAADLIAPSVTSGCTTSVQVAPRSLPNVRTSHVHLPSLPA